MPRLSSSLLIRARNISPLLPLLLQACRTLPSARNELRWLQEHVTSKNQPGHISSALLLYMCHQRARGIPLQYLLGSQPFGELDILCRPGVLIPRPETEAYTSRLASLILHSPDFVGASPLKILDLCTGTGCIPLSLYSILHPKFSSLTICGIDISPKSLELANENLEHNINGGPLHPSARDYVTFTGGDVLSESFQNISEPGDPAGKYDIVVSNPPYISEFGFGQDTARSVRNWEPKLALVPQPIESGSDRQKGVKSEDIFYPRILRKARKAEAKVVLMEVGDMDQGLRIARLAVDLNYWTTIEIWRDSPDLDCDPKDADSSYLRGQRIAFKGAGQGRSVVCWK